MRNYKINVREYSEIELDGAESVTRCDARFHHFQVRAPAIGIDPGDRNMGIAIVSPERNIRTYQIRFNDASDAVERIIQTVSVTRAVLGEGGQNRIACVERAAFSKPFGQVALAENRSAAIQALLMEGIDDIVVPAPGSIRLIVFGSGTIKAENIWPELGNDASSALACALYALLV